MVQVKAPTLVGKTLQQGRAAVKTVNLQIVVTGLQPSQGAVIPLDGVRIEPDYEVGIKSGGGTTSPFNAQMVTISSSNIQPGQMVDEGGEIGVIIYNPYEGKDQRSDEAQR